MFFSLQSRIAAGLLLSAMTAFITPSLPLAAQSNNYRWQPSSEGLFGATGKTFGFALNGNVVVGTPAGIFVLRNGEAIWRETTVRSEVTHIATTNSGAMMAGTLDGTFRSTDNGETWQSNFALSAQTNFVAAADTLLFSTQGGSFFGPPSYYFKSTDDGKTWSTIWVQEIRGGENWIILNAKRERLMTTDSGLMISKDHGKSWKPTGFTPFIYRILAPSPAKLLATTTEGVWESADNGTSWQKVDTMPFNDVHVAPNGSYFYRFSGGSTARQAHTMRGIYRSTDNGATRRQLLSSLNPTGLGIAPNGTIWVSANSTILRSTNNGDTWERYDRGISNVPVSNLEYSPSGDLFALAGSGRLPSQTDFFSLYRSSDNGESWEYVIDSLDNRLLAAGMNGSVFAARGMVAWKPNESVEFVDSTTVILLHSPDRGQTWNSVAAEGSLTTFASDGASTVAAGFTHKDLALNGIGGDVAFSVDNGASWRRLTEAGAAWAPPAQSKPVNTVAVLQNNFILFSTFAIVDTLINEVGLYRIRPNGVVESLSADRLVQGLATAPDGTVFAAAATLFRASAEEPFQEKDHGIYRSTDNGDSWTKVYTLQALTTTTFHFGKEGVAFATVEGMAGLRSTDNGLTWTEMKNGAALLPLTDYQFHSSGSIFALLFNTPQYTIDKGRTWYSFGNGLPWPGATSQALSAEDEMLCGTLQHGVYKVVQTSGVEHTAGNAGNRSKGRMELQEAGDRLQTVRFSVEAPGLVSLSLHDLLGRPVATFFNQHLEAGEQRIRLDLSAIPAGTYLLVLSGPDGLLSEKVQLR